MHRTAQLLLTLLALACAGNALAGGRWACRLEYPLETTCYAESIAWSLGNLEVGAGAEARWTGLDEPLELTPYSVIAWYAETYWSAIELATPTDFSTVGFRFALSFGGRW